MVGSQRRVHELQFDEWNEAEAARHGVRAWEIEQVLYDNAPVFLPNRKGHDAPIIMLGYTLGGRPLTVPLGQTSQCSLWRPASAWDASKHELARYKAVK